MAYTSHPILSALRKICSGNVAQYEAMIAVMKESLLLEPKGWQRFKKELRDENEMIYSADETFKTLASGKKANLKLLYAIFPDQRKK
jgi:hypothetical protein